jgi:hypothetical protein
VGQLLGLSRIETEAFLSRHLDLYDYDPDALDHQVSALEQMSRPPRDISSSRDAAIRSKGCLAQFSYRAPLNANSLMYLRQRSCDSGCNSVRAGSRSAIWTSRFDSFLASELDPGEAEAIQLALKRRAAILIMDERRGRLIGERKDLVVIGALGMLVEAYRRKWLDDPLVILDELRSAGFRVSRRLVVRFNKLIGARRARIACFGKFTRQVFKAAPGTTSKDRK